MQWSLQSNSTFLIVKDDTRLVDQQAIFDRESCIRNDEMGAKIEFLGLRKDSSIKIGFAITDNENVWLGIQHKYPILSRKVLSFLIQCPSTYYWKVGFSTMASIKTKY